jgi:hypothetical protein
VYPDLVGKWFARHKVAVGVSIGAGCVIVACGAFSGADVANGGGGADAGPSDATFSADNALTVDAAFTDAAFTDAADGQADGGTCTQLYSVPLTQLPMGWTSEANDGSAVTFDPSAPSPIAPALKAHVLADTVGEAADVHIEAPLNAGLKSIQATFSLYLSDAWDAAGVDTGCTFEVFDTTRFSSARLVTSHYTDGTINVSLAASTVQQGVLYATTPAPGWYDATMTLTGLNASEIFATTTLAPHGGGTPVTQSTKPLPLTFQPAILRVTCGISHTYSLPTATVDEWVANASVLLCE